MSQPLLHAEGISVRRGRRLVLEPCDVTISPGEVVGLYGPNGAGKSTLLQALAGLLPLASGHLCFDGQRVGRDLAAVAYRRQIAAVFQEPLLLRGTVGYNVALGLSLRGVPSPEQASRVASWLTRLQIGHLMQRRVGTLSGGEAQRVSLARTLVLEPHLVFLDEPFASLDAPTRFRLVDELAAILTERRIAAFFVTHDLTEASALCTRCLVLEHGRVLQESALKDLLHRPRSRRVAEITGMENILDATVSVQNGTRLELDWDGQKVRVTAGSGHIGNRVTFTVRPQDVHLAPDGDETGPGMNRFRGHVERVRRHGYTQLVSVRVGQTSVLQALAPMHLAVTPGMAVTVTLPPQALWIMAD
jgi:tungstate transport system ATP-binding protein